MAGLNRIFENSTDPPSMNRLLLAFTIAWFSAPNSPLRAAEGMTIVTFGDSVTAARGRTVVYPALLASDLSYDGQDVKVINAGIGGNTTNMAKVRFEKDVLLRKPDLVVVMFGLNDAAVDVWKDPPADKPRVALADYRKNLTEMIQTLKEQGTRVVLMTSNPLNWSETTLKLYGKSPYQPEDVDGLNVMLHDYITAVREIAKTENVGFVDVFAAFEAYEAEPNHKPGSLSSDGMHPGDAGHRIIANLLIEHLAKVDPKFARKPFTVWHQSGEAVEMHPRSTDLTHDTKHPAVLGPSLVKLDDGAVMSVYSTPTSYGGKPGECYIASRTTRDGGKTWEVEREITRLPDGRSAHPTSHRARDGSLHVFFLGYKQHAWDRKTENPTEDTRSDLWTVRSKDDGETWSQPQMIFQGYTGSTNGAEETSGGNLVVPFSHYVANPGRLVSRSVVSGDGGLTWVLSNQIDIGGAGDHDGAVEPCVIELQDKRLWMIIRTTRQFFWESFSEDGGLTWSVAKPTQIRSSSSPGHVIRLADGRLALAWNPDDRSELCLAFSKDEGRTWTESVVVARGSTTYPFLLENTPGELWVGFIDPHDGWGKTPRARHLKIAVEDVSAEANHPTEKL
jgi:lysophospholipase L1-like esterase